LEIVLIVIISLLSLVLIGFARARAYRNQLNELRIVHFETCKRLETSQCRIKCKHLTRDEILEAEFVEDK